MQPLKANLANYFIFKTNVLTYSVCFSFIQHLQNLQSVKLPNTKSPLINFMISYKMNIVL